MTRAYISINGQTIRKNAVTGSKDAPIRIGKSPFYGRIDSRGRIVAQ